MDAKHVSVHFVPRVPCEVPPPSPLPCNHVSASTPWFVKAPRDPLADWGPERSPFLRRGRYHFGIVTGSLAVLWSLLLLARAVQNRNIVEAVNYVAMFTWLFGNGWWMYAELHDAYYPKDLPLYKQHQSDAFRIMLSALCFLAVTYILRAIPVTKQWFAVSAESLAVYDEAKFRPGDALGQVFPTWRSIENLHIFCWLGKDTGWSGACAPACGLGTAAPSCTAA